MDINEIRSRINPVYQDVRGTESYERKWLCDRLAEVERQRDQMKAALELILTRTDLSAIYAAAEAALVVEQSRTSTR